MTRIDLNGTWRCTFPDGTQRAVRVPGCFDLDAGRWDIADPVLYERTFAYAPDGMRARLVFGAVSYACEVFVNGRPAGAHEGMWDAFALDVSDLLVPGENTLRVAVTKPGYHSGDPYPLRQVLSGFIPDVLSTFGGLWDDVSLETAPRFFIDTHHASGNCAGDATIAWTVDVAENTAVNAHVTVFDAAGMPVAKACREGLRVQPGGGPQSLSLRIADPALWSLHSPSLYSYQLTLEADGQQETVGRRFGFREIRYDQSTLLLNGEPVYLRGLLHWGFYDDRMAPNPTEAEIRQEIEQCKAYGFNALKHCLYIPRRRYFDLADEYGMLLWVELPLWLPEETPQLAPRIRREYPRLLTQMQGHPSLALLSLGCELDDTVQGGLLSELYALAKRETQALVRDNSGSGECYGGLAIDYADFFDYHFYGELQNMENLMEVFTPAWRNTRPWLFGEFCDSDTLRDLARVRAAKGVDRLPWEARDPAANPISLLKPDFFLDRHDAAMEASGIRAEFDALRALSYDHSMVHRKVTLEQTRAFAEICGYNITSIRDVPIATSGMFDDFMRPKFPQEAFRRFNDDLALVPAFDLGRVWINADRVRSKERYNYTAGEQYAVHVLLSNYGGQDVAAGTLRWRFEVDGQTLRQGEIALDRAVARGQVAEIGYVYFTLPPVDAPANGLLHVSLEADGQAAENEWPLFLYPQAEAPQGRFALYDPCNLFTTLERVLPFEALREADPIPAGVDVVITSLLTEKLRAYMREGGRVFLVQRDAGTLPSRPVGFWREGMLRPYPHPVLSGIEKTHWQEDLRYFGMSTGSAFQTDAFAAEGYAATPILRRYDCREWYASDYMLSFALGKGRCIATTLRLEGGMGKEPLFLRTNPFAVWLLYQSLRNLMQND